MRFFYACWRMYAQYASMNEFMCSEHSVRIRIYVEKTQHWKSTLTIKVCTVADKTSVWCLGNNFHKSRTKTALRIKPVSTFLLSKFNRFPITDREAGGRFVNHEYDLALMARFNSFYNLLITVYTLLLFIQIT